MQEVGAEWGVTTGRRRRTGWLDLVVLNFSNLINGYDALNLTKLDVLDGFDEIKIGVGYTVDGKDLPSFPGAFPPATPLSVAFFADPQPRPLALLQPTSSSSPRSRSSTSPSPAGRPTSRRSRRTPTCPRTAASTSSSSRTLSASRSSGSATALRASR